MKTVLVYIFFALVVAKASLFGQAVSPRPNSRPDSSALSIIRLPEGNALNVRSFGALGNGSADDHDAIQKGIDYILNNDQSPRTLFFPPGTYRISKPLLIARIKGNTYLQSTINLVGPTSAKNASVGYATIEPDFNNTFAIGIQLGKGILIRGLAIIGKFKFPNTLSYIQVDTLGFSEWTDRTVRQNTRSPYSGIVIDPFSDASAYPDPSDMYPGLTNYCLKGMGPGGSTAVQIVDCSIRNFIVGVMITPSHQQNGELIDVLDCDISYNKVGYAMGQAQSKECHVVRLKCWGPTHTLFDNVTYGFQRGDGAGVPMVDGVNIASAVKQLCNILCSSFGGSFRNVYAEGLFRLGFAGGNAGLSFSDCQLDFSSQDAGLPYPDFYVQGNRVTFRDCMLRIYPGIPGMRLVLSGTNNHFDGGCTNAPPITINIDNNSTYPNPVFHNMTMYYSGGILGNSNPGIVNINAHLDGSNGNGPDPVYPGNTYSYQHIAGHVAYKFTYLNNYDRLVTLSGKPVLHVDKKKWTAFFKVGAPTDINWLKAGDFILTAGLNYQDQFRKLYAPTYPVGIIRQISHDTVYLDNLAIGIHEGTTLPLWMDYFVNEKAAFTGDIAAGSNTIVNVQGVFPEVGERPDIPMLAIGTYVIGTDQKNRTITFSTGNMTGQSYKDFTFMNGYPNIEMYGTSKPEALQKNGETLFGSADYYRYDNATLNTNDANFPFRKGLQTEHYKIYNTNIGGEATLHKLSYQLLSSGRQDPPAKK